MNAKQAKQLLAKRQYKFTLPETGIEIIYRKPDPIKSALQNQFPTFLTEAILSKMKTSLKGQDVDIDTDRDFTDGDVADLLGKSYILLKELSIEPKFGDAEDDETVLVTDVPDVDALAFLSEIVNSLKTAQMAGGGEITEDEIGDFSKRKRGTKRS